LGKDTPGALIQRDCVSLHRLKMNQYALLRRFDAE
jgi:hypothetical protein